MMIPNATTQIQEPILGLLWKGRELELRKQALWAEQREEEEADELFARDDYEFWMEGLETVIDHVTGVAPIAEYHEGEFGCAIHWNFRMVYLRDGWEPAPSGRWQGDAEPDWGMTSEQWYRLPIRERALMECREQVQHWVELEFGLRWLDQYYHEEFQGLHRECFGDTPSTDAEEAKRRVERHYKAIDRLVAEKGCARAKA